MQYTGAMPIGHNYTIVVGTDFSGMSDRAIDHALEQASLNEGSEVHILYVEPSIFDGAISKPEERTASADAAVAKTQERAKDRVGKMDAGLRKSAIRRVVTHFRRGSAAEGVAQLAADLDADLVVVGSHGHRGLERFFLGSVAEKVSRLARCPVWIVRPKDHSAEGRTPQIEPPCPDCVAARRASDGKQMWCARHLEHHYMPPHVHHYVNDGLYSADTTAYEATPERGA
jgi:nucleotide-binding universal stress UspA family protein